MRTVLLHLHYEPVIFNAAWSGHSKIVNASPTMKNVVGIRYPTLFIAVLQMMGNVFRIMLNDFGSGSSVPFGLLSGRFLDSLGILEETGLVFVVIILSFGLKFWERCQL